MKPRALLLSLVLFFARSTGDHPQTCRANDPAKRNQRAEEVNRLLDTIEVRCRKMLDLQMAVHHRMKVLSRAIETTADKKPQPERQHTTQRLAALETDIVLAATKAIDMLEAENSAVAFAEVFRELRKDMKNVQRRLKVGDVGADTQAIEQDIIDTLTDVIKSFKSH
jgi:hypothetical protein